MKEPKIGGIFLRQIAKNKELILWSTQVPGKRHAYSLKGNDLEAVDLSPANALGAVDLSPENALLVAKALLKDLSYRPWSPEGAEAASILGLFMSPKKAVR